MNAWQNKEMLKTSSQNKKAAGVGVATAQIHITIAYKSCATQLLSFLGLQSPRQTSINFY
jgi:hypothetical protein